MSTASECSIPIHLLTRESLELYWRHLRPDGILAIHISNYYLDLRRIVVRLGREMQKQVILIKNPGDDDYGIESSTWALMTDSSLFLSQADVLENAQELPAPGPLWTDDYSSTFEILKRHQR